MRNKTIIAIVTARGGSKGLPRKNIRQFCGLPLIAWTIRAALECSSIARCIVSTEDAEIKRISLSFGAEVVDRPKKLAGDAVSSFDVVKNVLISLYGKTQFPDYFILLQPTSPLRTAKHLAECIGQFDNRKYQSAISVTPSEHHPYKALKVDKNCLQPLFAKELLNLPRQLLPSAFRQNGAIYLEPTERFLREETFFVPPVMPYLMSASCSVDIDTAMDFHIAERLFCDGKNN